MSDPGREFIELLSVPAWLGEFRSVLVEAVTLAGEAPGLSDEQVRVRLVGLADRVSRRLQGEIR